MIAAVPCFVFPTQYFVREMSPPLALLQQLAAVYAEKMFYHRKLNITLRRTTIKTYRENQQSAFSVKLKWA